MTIQSVHPHSYTPTTTLSLSAIPHSYTPTTLLSLSPFLNSHYTLVLIPISILPLHSCPYPHSLLPLCLCPYPPHSYTPTIASLSSFHISILPLHSCPYPHSYTPTTPLSLSPPFPYSSSFMYIIYTTLYIHLKHLCSLCVEMVLSFMFFKRQEGDYFLYKLLVHKYLIY